ncbi:cell division protein ZapD [Gallaecimonas sp. GXIMD4217]|uniref:cell division protein ZapD n=1 Tax=Gallaecimonas sp. GXIMD4217 TaxID=3131927 RepID=UPI00311B2FB3
MAVTYEFPLSEKLRTYLRLEEVLERLFCKDNPHFFQALFNAQDVLERGELRADLSKDLERLMERLQLWSQRPEVDGQRLQQMHEDLRSLRHWLAATPKPGQAWRDDKFLASLRSRYAVPGGDTNFDLPQLQCWHQRSIELRQAEISAWLDVVAPLQQSLQSFLHFLRELGHSESVLAKSGFYQNAGDQLVLVRISGLPVDVFPMVSGHRGRYTVRLMRLCDDGEQQAVTEDMAFNQQTCAW